MGDMREALTSLGIQLSDKEMTAASPPSSSVSSCLHVSSLPCPALTSSFSFLVAFMPLTLPQELEDVKLSVPLIGSDRCSANAFQKVVENFNPALRVSNGPSLTSQVLLRASQLACQTSPAGVDNFSGLQGFG